MKVKCINDDFSKVKEEIIKESKGFPIQWPVKGETYTIRQVFENDDIGVKSYLLNELHNPTFFIPVLGVRRELAFADWRFEEITENVNSEVIEEEKELLTTQ